MNTPARLILRLPSASSFSGRLGFRRDLLRALRFSEVPVILDLSNRQSLDYEDIDLLLDSMADAVGRDTKLVLVAGSDVIRVLLDVTRVSSVVPVFDSVTEALNQAQPPLSIEANRMSATHHQLLRSA